MKTGTEQHRELAPDSVSAAVLTISDTRTLENDTAGSFLVAELTAKGHRVLDRRIVKDDADAIRSTLSEWLERGDVQVIITTGGTGIARRDNTIQTIESLLDKPMPGFGEIFRMLSYQEVRGAAILSRAVGGLARRSLIFALPGSLNAVQTGWNGILRDELAHLVWETVR